MTLDPSIIDWRSWPELILSKLFPSVCLLCSAPGQDQLDLCIDCHSDLRLNHSYCQRCAVPLINNSHSDEHLICGECLQNRPYFDYTLAPYLYKYPLDYLVHALKFRHRLLVARLFANLLIQELAQHERPDCIIPVPLHHSRLRERGFNQSLEIAKPLAKQLAIPLLANQLHRTRRTRPQLQLPLAERTTNLRNAFAIKGKLSTQYQHIVIFDDVVTSGSTANEIAKILRSAGVAKIGIWACARTPRERQIF